MSPRTYKVIKKRVTEGEDTTFIGEFLGLFSNVASDVPTKKIKSNVTLLFLVDDKPYEIPASNILKMTEVENETNRK